MKAYAILSPDTPNPLSVAKPKGAGIALELIGLLILPHLYHSSQDGSNKASI
jgi:hypothetical protein